MNVIAGTRTWVNRRSLDLRLAEGESSLSSPDLSYRARQLESHHWRHLLAAGIRRLVEDAERPPRPLSSAVPIRRRSIVCARAALEDLAAEIESGGPIAVEGLARVQLLITDGDSPLFSSSPDGAIEDAVRGARAALMVS